MFHFQCTVSNVISLDMARTSADEPTLCVVVAARSMLISISAQLLPTASIAKAIIEEQAILRYRAEHGGTFQQSSGTYAQGLKPSLKPKQSAQPKASDKVSTPVTPKAKAQRHTPPSSPKGAVSRPADTPRARKPSKEGAPREKVNRFGTILDMDVDSVSD